MGTINYDLVYKRILKEAINDCLNGNDGRNELSYVDVFYPKIEVLIGINGVMKIFGGDKPILEVFLSSGLDAGDYESIGRTLSYGIEAWNNDSTEERLSEITKISENLLAGYFDKVRTYIIANPGNGRTVDYFDERVKNLSNVNPVIFNTLDVPKMSKTA